MLETMRILVVEDDRKIASFVVNGLKQNGYAVDHAAGWGKRASSWRKTITYDAAVVDIMLPKLDGLSPAPQFRAGKASSPRCSFSARKPAWTTG